MDVLTGRVNPSGALPRPIPSGMRILRRSGISQVQNAIRNIVKGYILDTGITIPAGCGYSTPLVSDFLTPPLNTGIWR